MFLLPIFVCFFLNFSHILELGLHHVLERRLARFFLSIFSNKVLVRQPPVKVISTCGSLRKSLVEMLFSTGGYEKTQVQIGLEPSL
jgi:hypothetical protein